jgi:hypothetical protein
MVPVVAAVRGLLPNRISGTPVAGNGKLNFLGMGREKGRRENPLAVQKVEDDRDNGSGSQQ